MAAATVAPSTIGFRLALRPSAAAARDLPAVPEAQLVGAIQLHPLLLTRPADVAVDLGKAVVGFGLPRDMARIGLELQGTTYELLYSSEVADPGHQLRHVTMAVPNQPGSYARFSVEPGAGRIYGHLYTPTATYRFVPGAAANEQLVYRLSSRGPAPKALHMTDSPEPAGLARRHQQIEAISRIRPADVHTLRVIDELRSARVVGGQLGAMRAPTAAEFMTAMTQLAVISQVTGKEDFRVGEIVRYGANRRVTFIQHIDGIPVDGANEVGLDSRGNILYFQTQLFPWDAWPVRANLTQQEAWRRAFAQWQGLYGSYPDEVDLDRPYRLYYSAWDDQQRLTLVHEFRFTVPAHGPMSYQAQINAETGHVEIVELTRYSDFGHTVCADISRGGFPRPPKLPPIPEFCGARGTRILYSVEPGAVSTTCPGDPTQKDNPCRRVEEQTLTRVMTDVAARMEASSELNRPATSGSPPLPRCCAGIGGANANIDIISDTRHNRSMGARDTIYLAPNDKGVEALVHEWAHVFTTTYNDRLLGYSDLFAGAIIEGMADVISGLYGEISPDKAKFGDPWVNGDGQGASIPQRSGRIPRTFSDINVLRESHASGQVFYNFFFRLKQASPDTSFERLLGIALGTLATIARFDGRVLQPSDFRAAVIGTLNRETESALLEAVIRVFDAMANRTAGPPGTPGPDGAPAAPASVFGSFAFCGTFQDTPVSVFNMSWTPVFNATDYQGYLRRAGETFFRHEITILAPQNELLAFTNRSAEARVGACNDAGCSGLSPSGLFISHQPQCASF